MKLAIILIILSLVSSATLCSSYNNEYYELQITVNVQEILPLQYSPFPPTVNFELKNLGDKPFNGVLSLHVDLEKASFSYSDAEFRISNLQKNDVYKNSSSYGTYSEGFIWFTFNIESNDLSNIRLYHDSKLEAEGFRVSFQTSVYLLPAMVWIGIMAGIVVPIIIAILWKKRSS